MSNRNAEKLLDSIQPKPPAPTEAVSNYVMRKLGRPPNLFAVQVRCLWEDHYRVNVLVGENAASVTIAHSYFLVMGSDGNCLSSSPTITRAYAPKTAAIGLIEYKSGDKETRHVHAPDVN